MICPHDNSECFSVRCDANKSCVYPVNSPPKPTIAEIERLAGDVSMALSTLLAAVKKNLQP